MEAKMKAQMPTFEPATQSPPRQQLTPLTICQKALVQRLRATLKPVDQETSPLLPAVQPINFDLVDESWLNSTPGQEDQGMETEQVPALTKLLHGGKK